MRLFRNTRIDFLSLRWHATVLSLLVIAAGATSMLLKGGLRMGIDFAGGSQIIVRFAEPLDPGELRAVLTEQGLGSSQVQQLDDADEALIRTPLVGTTDSSLITEQVAAALDRIGGYTIVGSEWVGPQVGQDLRRQAAQAMVFSLAGMLAYISYRFEMKYGVAAVIALGHDVLVTLGAFSLTDREMNLPVIAALLTIVGYSLNDTVVIFDRIRENNQALRGASFYERINVSVNQTLSRTILTSATTLMVVAALFFFGGPMINDFAFAMLVGVIAGTYSTVFIANPIVLYWEARRTAQRRAQSGPTPAARPAARRHARP
jgi:preprotein translocase SecF subunit